MPEELPLTLSGLPSGGLGSAAAALASVWLVTFDHRGCGVTGDGVDSRDIALDEVRAGGDRDRSRRRCWRSRRRSPGWMIVSTVGRSGDRPVDVDVRAREVDAVERVERDAERSRLIVAFWLIVIEDGR